MLKVYAVLPIHVANSITSHSTSNIVVDKIVRCMGVGRLGGVLRSVIWSNLRALTPFCCNKVKSFLHDAVKEGSDKHCVVKLEDIDLPFSVIKTTGCYWTFRSAAPA